MWFNICVLSIDIINQLCESEDYQVIKLCFLSHDEENPMILHSVQINANGWDGALHRKQNVDAGSCGIFLI